MLTVIIIAKDEEANIARCLESVSFADEIIVLDSGSTDNTVSIAKQYTDKVFSTDWPGYGIQKQRALAQATGDWVLNLDADESLTEPLQQEIQRVIAANEADAYRVAIRMFFYQQALKYSSSPKRHIRLFKRAHASYSKDIVHEKIILPPDTKIDRLKHAIAHHSYQDVSHVLSKMNRYSSYSAKIRIENNKKISFSRAFLNSSWMFFRCFFLQRGFLDGKLGLLYALFNAQGAFYRGIKQLYQDKELHKLPQVLKTEEASYD